MSINLAVSPTGRPVIEASGGDESEPLPDAVADRIRKAFGASASAGLLLLATSELRTTLPAAFAFARSVAQAYLTRLSHTPGLESAQTIEPIAPPEPELAALAQQAPPLKGSEYINADALAQWWKELDEHVRDEIAAGPEPAGAYLRAKNPLWRMVGRVTFHLAENKRDEQYPFAFMATYAHRLSAQGRCNTCPFRGRFRSTRGRRTERRCCRC